VVEKMVTGLIGASRTAESQKQELEDHEQVNWSRIESI
jgi:hypothetical protein